MKTGALLLLALTSCGVVAPATDAATDGTAADASGVMTPPSCMGLSSNCGPENNQDCCKSQIVPGGSFYRRYDGVNSRNNSLPATVSDFRLDVYPVTVGRFRRFVTAYPWFPQEGAGTNPRNPDDPGWKSKWNAAMLASRAELSTKLSTSNVPGVEAMLTWTEEPKGNESKPLVYVTYYEAFAFCIWDGGRLPTEAEYNYAMSGGDEQRVYPWSVPSTSTIIPFSLPRGDAPFDAVGSRSPRADGRWGHADLGDSAEVWTRDVFMLNPPPPTPCVDCAPLDDTVCKTCGVGRTIKGGRPGLSAAAAGAGEVARIGGIRCARAP